MSRWVSFTVCAALGLVTLACGWLVPAYMKAVDRSVLQRAGRNTPELTRRGMELAMDQQLGAARLLAKAAAREKLQGAEKLSGVINELAAQHPIWLAWGSPAPGLQAVFGTNAMGTESVPFTDFVVRTENRQKALDFLGTSQRLTARNLLACRSLTRLAIFSPSQSASGQAFDTAIGVCGLLSEEGQLTPALNGAIAVLASDANKTGHSEPLERCLLDFMSLGQRLDWNQLERLVAQVQDVATLHQLAAQIRQASDGVPVIFSAVELSGQPAAATRYLAAFSKTGLADLGTSLRYGAGSVKELLQRDQRLYRSGWREFAAEYNPFRAFFRLAQDYCWRAPWFALMAKWLLFLDGGFLVAMSMHFARPVVSDLEKPLQVPGFHLARESLFALGFLLVALILNEPFLSQDNQAKAPLPFHLHLPTAGAVVQAANDSVQSTFMNQSNQLLNSLIMLLFFVVQGLLYTACVVKLAEIRRQRVGPRIKLKLLENEEHLFDAGLYLGFLGTIVSFIIYSMFAKHEFSLMVAYSSTSFGILYVSFFKIFHLRPVRRRLLLEAEVKSVESMPPARTPTLASS